ncbi:MAG TPA: hypothetical protein VEF04_20470 [Blastocatellia bacterium]|nr:hypothetical protein [Blastocatellia bacterium]
MTSPKYFVRPETEGYAVRCGDPEAKHSRLVKVYADGNQAFAIASALNNNRPIRAEALDQQLFQKGSINELENNSHCAANVPELQYVA